jgi:hypothetical protein
VERGGKGAKTSLVVLIASLSLYQSDMNIFIALVFGNIEPGKPWQNGSCESFNGTFRKKCLNAEVFSCLTEARVVIEKWRCRYNE